TREHPSTRSTCAEWPFHSRITKVAPMASFDLAHDLDRAFDLVRRAIEAASTIALKYYRPEGIGSDTKPDRSPVTAADREAEEKIIALIRAEFPAHAILSEESGMLPGDSKTRWIVDPLDGTRGFTRGGSFWGPLVALEHEGSVVAGGMAMPVMRDVF